MRLALALAFAGLATAVPVSGSAQARPDLRESLRTGIVGERFDGYLGVAAPASDAVKRQVAAVNIRRRALYIDLAARRRVSTRYAALATGCELLAGLGVGQAYMLADGQWRVLKPGERPPVPDYCAGSPPRG